MQLKATILLWICNTNKKQTIKCSNACQNEPMSLDIVLKKMARTLSAISCPLVSSRQSWFSNCRCSVGNIAPSSKLPPLNGQLGRSPISGCSIAAKSQTATILAKSRHIYTLPNIWFDIYIVIQHLASKNFCSCSGPSTALIIHGWWGQKEKQTSRVTNKI